MRFLQLLGSRRLASLPPQHRCASTAATPKPAPDTRSEAEEQVSTSRPNRAGGGDPPQVPVIGILGGGISGLSAAYYITKKYGDKVRPIVIEQSDRVGGWVKTVVSSKTKSMYEVGPRTIRPAGVTGMNTLDLVEELGLHDRVLYVEKSHPTAKNRLLFVKGKLVKLPTDPSVLFKSVEPFSRPLVFAFFRDIFKARKSAPDDSIYDFINRRFGTEAAEYLADPMIRGICAGDARKTSVKFLMKELFELEQKYGSVVLGTLLSKFGKQPCKLSPDDKDIGFSNIALSSLTRNWAVWTLETGLQTLPETLERVLTEKGVRVCKRSRVEGITFGKRVTVQYSVDGARDSVTCDHVVSALPASKLAGVLQRSTSPGVEKAVALLEKIRSASLQVTGLTYDTEELIDEYAFGFLVPSSEKSVGGLLGIVFDTHSFPQSTNSVITCMSKGPENSEEHIDTILSYVNKTLGVSRKPTDYHSEMLRECIPQYTVGHYERVADVRKALDDLPVTLVGASYDGVSVNDCVYSGRKCALAIERVVVGVNKQEVVA